MYKFLLSTLAATCVGSAATASIPSLEKKALVTVQKMETKTHSDLFVYPARVESKINSVVAAEADGRVKRILKSIGARVRRGDIILTIENQDPVYTFATIPVKAPASGIVSQVNVSLMGKVTRGEDLFTITDPASLKVTTEVPAGDLESLKIGSLGRFKTQVSDQSSVSVKIVGLSPIVDPKTGTARAELTFENVKTAPSAGNLGQVEFTSHPRSILLLPESALTYKDGKPFARVLVDGKLLKKPILLGPQTNDVFEIKDGLSNGDTVILRTNRFVKEGESVDIEAKDQAKELK